MGFRVQLTNFSFSFWFPVWSSGTLIYWIVYRLPYYSLLRLLAGSGVIKPTHRLFTSFLTQFSCWYLMQFLLHSGCLQKLEMALIQNIHCDVLHWVQAESLFLSPTSWGTHSPTWLSCPGQELSVCSLLSKSLRSWQYFTIHTPSHITSGTKSTCVLHNKRVAGT